MAFSFFANDSWAPFPSLSNCSDASAEPACNNSSIDWKLVALVTACVLTGLASSAVIFHLNCNKNSRQNHADALRHYSNASSVAMEGYAELGGNIP